MGRGVENQGDEFNFSFPATYLSSPDRKQLFLMVMHAVHLTPFQTPSLPLVMAGDGVYGAPGASASEDGPCPRLSEIISWVATAVLAVCHAPLVVMSRRPPLQNSGQLGAVTEPHHISTKQRMTFQNPAGVRKILMELHT